MGGALDQRAGDGDVAQPRGVRIVLVEDMAGPDQRMATFAAARAGDRHAGVGVGRGVGGRSGGQRLGLRKGAADGVEQHRVAGRTVGFDRGFVGEFQPEPVAANPAHRAFER